MNQMKELINLVNDSIQQQNKYLRQLKIDDKETMECNEKISELKEQIQKERKNLNKSIFDNQSIKFEANTHSIDEHFLGKLIINSSDFTVVFKSIFLILLNYALMI